MRAGRIPRSNSAPTKSKVTITLQHSGSTVSSLSRATSTASQQGLSRSKSRLSQLERKYSTSPTVRNASYRREHIMLVLALVLVAGFFVQGMYIYDMKGKRQIQARCVWHFWWVSYVLLPHSDSFAMAPLVLGSRVRRLSISTPRTSITVPDTAHAAAAVQLWSVVPSCCCGNCCLHATQLSALLFVQWHL
jgi:hypothetical protein